MRHPLLPMHRAAGTFVIGVLAVACFALLRGGSASADPPSPAQTDTAAATDFDRQIAPLLARRCLECHNALEKKGGLDLTSSAAALAGGESGAALNPGKPDESYLWERVTSDEMPPKKPLADSDKALLRQWIAAGAKWGTDPIDRFQYTSDSRAGYDWWSLQKISPPPILPVAGKSPIDALVEAQLWTNKLSPSPLADRRTLIRRLSFDLLGLPPTPEETAAFVNNPAADAYEKLVDRLLASPRYGEHWARHWLDVARFGESDGFEYDRLRPNAWPYRDWVISALNSDMPYDEFVRLQIAGDVLRPGDGQALVATGFLVGGAFDGLVPAGEVMRQIMREDEMEDLVGTVSQTFLGLTVNCAHCHDHKFDPIRQVDYYQLVSALAGVKRSERDLPVPPPANVAELKQQLAMARGELASIDDPVRTAILAERGAAASRVPAPQPFAHWEFTSGLEDHVGNLHAKLVGTAKLTPDGLLLDGQQGYAQTEVVDHPFAAKTLLARVSLANLTQRGGAPISLETPGGDRFDALVFGETEPGRWMVGSEGFSRTKPVEGLQETADPNTVVHVAVVFQPDGLVTMYRDGLLYGKPYKQSLPAMFGKCLAHVVFGMRHAPVSEGKLLAGVIREASLFDRALTADEVAASAGAVSTVVTEKDIVARLPADQQARRSPLVDRIRSLQSQINPPPKKVYAVNPQTAPAVQRLERGNPTMPREVVAPGGVQVLGASSASFGLPADAPDADRRRQLAQWITGPENVLFARVMANRVWQHHFGAGLISTPNDFGFNGGQPSHPELLEYLSYAFVQSGFRLKALHREIVTSATYRQASRPNPQAVKIDAGNRLLWRYAPRRLEAETVRDSVLAVAGQLNLAMGGPGFRDFDTFDQKGTQFYEPRDPEGAEYNRRSIYRTWARGGRNPLLDTFDCPDPSTTSPQRGVTTTPLQALALLNNSFVLRMADRFAERVERETGKTTAERVQHAYLLAYGRQPTTEELSRVAPFVDQHGLAALCRVLINANEFLYIE